MKWVVAFFAFAGSCGAFAQGAFQNLDFEQANPAGGFTTAALFPGWQVYIGTTPTSVAGYDPQVVASEATVSVEDDKTGYETIQGNYTAFLSSATGGGGTVMDSVTLSQSGIVPSGTESIQLDAAEVNEGSFTVSIDSQVINLFPVEQLPRYTVYEGNALPWAGQDATLSITQLALDGTPSPSTLQLDDIMFSPAMVTPEPDPVILMGIGGALFAAYRRFAPKRR